MSPDLHFPPFGPCWFWIFRLGRQATNHYCTHAKHSLLVLVSLKIGFPLSIALQIKNEVVFCLSSFYLITLKALCMKARRWRDDHGVTDDRTISTLIMDVAANLKNADEQYMYSIFNCWLAEGWTSPRVSTFVPNVFRDLLRYNFCHLFICVLSPSQDDLSTVYVTATRLFTFFNRIEYDVDRLETTLINELELFSLPGSDVTEIDDPLLYEGKFIFGSSDWHGLLVHVRLGYVRWCRDQILSDLRNFCQDHHNTIDSLLVDVIDRIPTRTSDGRTGWLTEAFMNQFGWNLSGN